MMPPGRYPPGALGRAPFGRGAGEPLARRATPASGAPADPASILRDPRASGAENDPDVPRDPRTDRVGWPESSIDELGRVGVTPPAELTGAGRAALESELEPLSGIPGLYMRGPGGCIVRYELTDAGRAKLEELTLELEDLRELGERRGVLSRHARAVAAELDGKEPPRDRRERRSSAELERELVGKLAQEDAIDAELAAPVDVVELEPLEELRERVARERAPWLFMGVQLP